MDIKQIAHTNKWFNDWITEAWCKQEIKLGGVSLKGESMYWYNEKYLTHTDLYILKMKEPFKTK